MVLFFQKLALGCELILETKIKRRLHVPSIWHRFLIFFFFFNQQNLKNIVSQHISKNASLGDLRVKGAIRMNASSKPWEQGAAGS